MTGSTPLRLGSDAHVCESGGGFVFLDLKTDRYLGLTGDAAETLRAELAHNAERAHASLAPLLEAGVLTRDADDRLLATTVLPPPSSHLLADAPVQPGRITGPRLVRFIVSATAARHALARWPIRQTVAHARRLSEGRRTAMDLGAARELTAAFQRMRPLYPLDRRCLFEALALIEFLARHGVHPTWVFGVRLAPWRAHCWVEHGGVLFNDDLEEVGQYTPIFAV